MKRTSTPIDEQSVSDGMRSLGHLVAKGASFEAFGADGEYLCKCDTAKEARQAIIRADREQGTMLARLEDDGAPVA